MKKTIIFVMVGMMFFIVACNKENVTTKKAESVTSDATIPVKEKKSIIKEKNIVKENSGHNKLETEKKNLQKKKLKTKATLYIPNETASGFDTVKVFVKKCPEDLVTELIKRAALPNGSKILNFELDTDKKTAVLDMSQEYRNKILTMGTSGECMLVGSLVNTFIKYYDLENITLKSEGQYLESGHNIYEEPVEFYDF